MGHADWFCSYDGERVRCHLWPGLDDEGESVDRLLEEKSSALFVTQWESHIWGRGSLIAFQGARQLVARGCKSFLVTSNILIGGDTTHTIPMKAEELPIREFVPNATICVLGTQEPAIGDVQTVINPVKWLTLGCPSPTCMKRRCAWTIACKHAHDSRLKQPVILPRSRCLIPAWSTSTWSLGSLSTRHDDLRC